MGKIAIIAGIILLCICIGVIIMLTITSCFKAVTTNQGNKKPHNAKTFKKQYENPVIEKCNDSATYIFPRLEFYKVYEKERLVVDPLIPDTWIVTSQKNYYRNCDLDKALAEEKVIPRNDSEALQFAVSFIVLSTGSYYWVNHDKTYKNDIPQEYYHTKYLPKVTQKKDTYKVTVCFYYPVTRFSEFLYLYKNELIRHEIIIKGSDYKISKSDQITKTKLK
jgi:hypothetical protein